MKCPICNSPMRQLNDKGKPINMYWCLNCNKDITFFDDDTGKNHGWVAEDLHEKAIREKVRKCQMEVRNR